MDKPYYIGLTGAKKNVGDFLITHRCLKLLKELRPDRDIKVFNHWEDLSDRLDIINNSKGIIIFGGPGYQYKMYPGIYKLVPDLDSIKVPIIPMGLGWKGKFGDPWTISNYKFSPSSLQLLKKMDESDYPLSCRDYFSMRALQANGIKNTLMTGCPVWYHIPSLNKPLEEPSAIQKVVFTPAQSPQFRRQSEEIMKVLKELFPAAQIYCSFHRGIDKKDQFTREYELTNTKALRDTAESMGLQAVDTSGSLENISFYKDCDLHVGYRVHGHLDFLSRRKPSLLINEDGRGSGFSDALNIQSIDGYKIKPMYYWSMGKKNDFISRFIRKFFGDLKENPSAVNEIRDFLLEEQKSGFSRLKGIESTIDNYYKIMKEFIAAFP